MSNEQKRAAALRYDAETDQAPVMLAKGDEGLADEILRLASEYGVPVMEDPGLLKFLVTLDCGREIPAPLYEAAAAVFRKLYELDGGFHAQTYGE